MSHSLHPEVVDLLAKFSEELHKVIQNKLYGVYVYGSCAYNAFDYVHSDIDFVVVVEPHLANEDLMKINHVHRQLARNYPLAKRMDGQYIQLADVGKKHVDMDAYPWFRDGVFHDSGYADINSVTWWILKHDGITIYGPDVRGLDIAITWNDVLDTMDYNMNTYWVKRAKRPQTLLRDIDFSDAILTICRITHSITNGEIRPKKDSGDLALVTFPASWKPLIKEAMTIRTDGARSNPLRKLYRSYLTIKFIRWAVTNA